MESRRGMSGASRAPALVANWPGTTLQDQRPEPSQQPALLATGDGGDGEGEVRRMTVHQLRSGKDGDVRRAWWSVALFAPSLVAAFITGEALLAALGHAGDQAPPPGSALIAGLPALLVFSLPTLLVWYFGHRAGAARPHGRPNSGHRCGSDLGRVRRVEPDPTRGWLVRLTLWPVPAARGLHDDLWVEPGEVVPEAGRSTPCCRRHSGRYNRPGRSPAARHTSRTR
jgi:hypothetical protein